MAGGGGRARLLTACAAALLGAWAAPPPNLPIREARWLAPDALYESLVAEPPGCLLRPEDESARRSIAIGRIAFRAPLLLGGQAARAGLSCASCHRNGRGNPHFVFPGLSGPPGTADVTASLMSSHRGDGTFNPKPIPDLAAARPKIGRDPGNPELPRFIRGLVVEEFDGPEPSPTVLKGLADYVRAIRPAACSDRPSPIRLSTHFRDVEEAVELSRTADRETSRLLLAAARSTLEAIDQRFVGLEAPRIALRDADEALRALRNGSGDLGIWRRRWTAAKAIVRRHEARSLYSPAVLRRALSGSAAAGVGSAKKAPAVSDRGLGW